MPQSQRNGRPRSPQTEPVDFSAPPRPLGFGMLGSMGPAHYSRESTPDSGASHYMDYRDPSGKILFMEIFDDLKREFD